MVLPISLQRRSINLPDNVPLKEKYNCLYHDTITFCLYIAGLHQVIRSCPTNNYQVLGTCEFKILIVLKHFMLLHHG